MMIFGGVFGLTSTDLTAAGIWLYHLTGSLRMSGTRDLQLRKRNLPRKKTDPLIFPLVVTARYTEHVIDDYTRSRAIQTRLCRTR